MSETTNHLNHVTWSAIGHRGPNFYVLWQLGSCKLNGVEPQAWLANVLGRIADTPQNRPNELLPWNWAQQQKLGSGCIAASWQLCPVRQSS